MKNENLDEAYGHYSYCGRSDKTHRAHCKVHSVPQLGFSLTSEKLSVRRQLFAFEAAHLQYNTKAPILQYIFSPYYRLLLAFLFFAYFWHSLVFNFYFYSLSLDMDYSLCYNPNASRQVKESIDLAIPFPNANMEDRIQHAFAISCCQEINKILTSCQYIFFKGPILAEALYERPWMRKSADIDILVRPEDANLVLQHFRDAGYVYNGGKTIGEEDFCLNYQSGHPDMTL